MDLNRRLPRVDASRFSLVPRADVPRSTFVTTHTHKTTFAPGYLVPIFVDEVLPGDTHHGSVTVFARLTTPLFPLMDELELETFFFFCPFRLLWTNFKKMMGERANPSDSISYTTPQLVVTPAVNTACTLHDYFGIPGANQIDGGSSLSVSALPYRAYNKIYNDWFRDQNLQNSLVEETDDGPDTITDYVLRNRNKKHDYFTSALPWPLKGGTEVSTPLAGYAAVKGLATNSAVDPTDGTPGGTYYESGGSPSAPAPVNPSGWAGYFPANTANSLYIRSVGAASAQAHIYADLATATGVTINALRLAVQTQRLLERDARSGSRYTELLRSHFGVFPEDTRLQRPEYIGGGRTPLHTQAIPQTSATGLTGGTRPLGTLGAAATAADQHSFSYSATEHGVIIGLANVRAQITYQQGLDKMWKRSTRYDYYWPVFAHLGEQTVTLGELYAKGDNQGDTAVFGYQERWAEYRHRNSQITGLFRSTATGNIDEWHLSEQFGSAPALNSTFITDASLAVVDRALAVSATNMQILFDSVFKIKSTRPMPMFSVPGMMDRF